MDEDDDEGAVVGQLGDQRQILDGGKAAVAARRQGDAADRQPLVQPLEAPQASADAGRKLGRKGSCGERRRSEEHTSELQSLMRISYAVFCLKKKKQQLGIQHTPGYLTHN